MRRDDDHLFRAVYCKFDNLAYYFPYAGDKDWNNDAANGDQFLTPGRNSQFVLISRVWRLGRIMPLKSII